MKPYTLITLSFLGVLLAGGLLLMTPWATGGREISLVDALFTSTSALCVTGLVVVDPGTFFTIPGQLIILLLIQLGGLGVITVATMYALVLGKKIGLRQRLVLKEAMNLSYLGGVVKNVQYALRFTFIIEGIGAFLLFLLTLDRLDPWPAMYYGVFHAVSAFCNAGFDLWGRYFTPFCGLVPFAHDPAYLLVITALIILGGLGFPVLMELHVARGTKLSLHSQIVIITTAVLVVVGMVLILLFEWGGVLRGMGLIDKLVNSLFLSVTPRTCGFSTVDMNKYRSATLLLTMGLMFIGASPLSTGGGIKTSTLAVLLSVTWSRLRGKADAEVRERRLDYRVVYGAMTVTTLMGGLALTAIMAISLLSSYALPRIMFEVFSALGTVGLSTGITTSLPAGAKVILMILMFLGRLGPMTVAFALVERMHETGHVRMPQGNVMIG